MSRVLGVNLSFLGLVFLPALLPMDNLAEAVTQLKQVHVLTRHGARTPLPKDGQTLLETVGSTLTATGEKQMYEVGEWIRQTYNQNNFLEFYNPAEVFLESSNLDRTLLSANSLSSAVFPIGSGSLLPQSPSIPVYSRDVSNDVYLRSWYDENCPAFHERVEKVYDSQQWKLLESNSQGILAKLGSLFPDDQTNNPDQIVDGTVVMRHLWSYYDILKVVDTECNPDPTSFSCLGLGSETIALNNKLTPSEMNQLEALLGDTEELKFGVATAGNLLGSRLLWRMIDRMEESIDVKFFLYSAHAPTILGFLSTLKEWQVDDDHPDFGSAVIIEVYEEPNSGLRSIRVLYKAAKKSSATFIPLRDANCEVEIAAEDIIGGAPTPGNGNLLLCPLNVFKDWAEANTLSTTEEWCEACQNVNSDVCLRARSNNFFQDLEDSLESNEGDASLLVGILAGFVVGVTLMGISCFLFNRRPSRREDAIDTYASQFPAASKEDIGVEQSMVENDLASIN